MQNDQNHHRRSIRLKHYDYSQPGVYYITIVTREREHLFGDIIDDEMHLNSLGEIVRDEWLKTPSIRPEIELGEYIIMPNHFHAIIHILENEPSVSIGSGDRPVAPTDCPVVEKRPGPMPKSLGALVGGFKSSVTVRINQFRATPGVPVWQRNYYEHIITSEKDYDNTETYIVNNPLNRNTDNEYS